MTLRTGVLILLKHRSRWRKKDQAETWHQLEVLLWIIALELQVCHHGYRHLGDHIWASSWSWRGYVLLRLFTGAKNKCVGSFSHQLTDTWTPFWNQWSRPDLETNTSFDFNMWLLQPEHNQPVTQTCSLSSHFAWPHFSISNTAADELHTRRCSSSGAAQLRPLLPPCGQATQKLVKRHK